SRQTVMASSVSSGYGWLGDMMEMLPVFYDYANTTSNPLSVSIENERTVFPLLVGEESSIIMEPGAFYFGTFNITTEEFMHLSLSSRTDLMEAMVIIIDPDGVILIEAGVSEGNSDIYPFLTSGPGMYTAFIQTMSYDDNLIIMDCRLDAVTPIDLPIGGFAEGVLNGSEYFVDTEDGSLIHQEKTPSAVTYKFSTNFTTPGVITHSMNLPEIDTPIYDLYDPWIHITSGASESFFLDMRYTAFLALNGVPYYYQSFQNETYYLTVGGMENVEYMVHNDYAMIDELPVNEMFYIENNAVEHETKAYTLSLSQDSVLRVNSTEGTWGYSWDIFSVFDDNVYRLLEVSDNSAFGLASFYYLPAGEYLVTADCPHDTDAWGFYDFNLGSVIDGLGSVDVDVGSLIGLRFDTNALDWYNVTLSFDTHDNVTVRTDVHFFNTFGGQVHSHDLDMGTRQTGLSWTEYPSNFTSWIHEDFCDGFGIVVISPEAIYNNTDGLPGPVLEPRSLTYTVGVEDGIPWVFNDTATTSFTGWYNFTLGEPGDLYEDYLLTVDGEIGQWVNVSVSVEDVVDWTCAIFQEVNGTPQILYWGDLSDTFSGDYSGDASFQFGCISDTVNLYFMIQRTQAGEGRLDIAFDKFVMNTFEYMPPLTYQGEAVTPGVDLGIVAVGIGAAVVIVVVIVVILKKKPELLRRS
ncbi:MAG: hypothetical protein ACTSV2_11785, partial [Candidatus Thorarchaeota archaeon]